MQYKTTTKLFHGTYQYKIVLVCAGVSIFRNGFDEALEGLKKVNLSSNSTQWVGSRMVKTQEDLDYLFKLHSALAKLQDVDFRVEAPWLSVYTNEKSNIDKLSKLDKNRVKYISAPPANAALVENTIIMPKKDFEFRVTMGKTAQEHTTFIAWADSNKNVELTKSCKRDLEKHRSWGGTHFYITGNNNLLLARMHLGDSISKVERIIKA